MYPLIYHKTLSSEKWYSYSRHQQLLMIANELNRAQNSLIKNDPDNAVHAWERAFELTDLTISDTKNERWLKELLRFRELAGEVFVTLEPEKNKMLIEGIISLDTQAYNALHA